MYIRNAYSWCYLFSSTATLYLWLVDFFEGPINCSNVLISTFISNILALGSEVSIAILPFRLCINNTLSNALSFEPSLLRTPFFHLDYVSLLPSSSPPLTIATGSAWTCGSAWKWMAKKKVSLQIGLGNQCLQRSSGGPV